MFYKVYIFSLPKVHVLLTDVSEKDREKTLLFIFFDNIL